MLRTRSLVFAALVLLLTGVSFSTEAQELPFVHFTTESERTPLPSASVQKIHQDSLGYIWLGLYSTGLARYDGKGFTSYGVADGLADVTVREMVEDRWGRLWVGSETGLVVSVPSIRSYGPGQRVRFSTRIGSTLLPRTRIRANTMALDGRRDTLWVGTAGDGIYKLVLDAEGVKRVERVTTGVAAGAPNRGVNAILALPDGVTWVAFSDGQVLRYVDGEAPKVYGTNAPSALTAMASGRRGIWGGGADGSLWRFDPAADQFTFVAREFASRVFSILETERDLWAVSLGSGMLRLDPDDPAKRTLYTRRHGLLGDSMWDVFEDREKNLWFGQNGGVSRLRRDFAAFMKMTGEAPRGEHPNLPGPSAFCSLPPVAGSELPYTFVGTGEGLAVIDESGKSETISREQGLLSNSIYGLGSGGAGRLWIATSEGVNLLTLADAPAIPDLLSSKTFSLHGRAMRIDSFFAGGPFYSARRIDIPDPRTPGGAIETYWFAGFAGVVALTPSGEWLIFRSSTGISPSGATAVARDSHGYVWTASNDGGLFRSREPLTAGVLDRLLATSREREVTEQVFSALWKPGAGGVNASVRTLVEADGRMWVGTSRGIFVFSLDQAREVRNITSREGLGGDVIVGMERSPQTGRLWVSQNGGLAEIDSAAMKVVRVLTKEDGLADNEAWAYGSVAVASDGAVYFATPKGLTILRPELVARNTVPPIMRVTNFALRQDSRGQNEVQLEYAALSFSNERQVRFRTRLAGFDENWSAPTSDGKIRYTNLPAFFVDKPYTFEVVASNGEGIWSAEPLRYSFAITPAWWFRWWAFVIWTPLLGLILYALGRRRTLSLRRRNLVLEQAIAERTQEISRQAKELETLDVIVQAINREINLDHLFESILEQGLVLFPQAQKGVFWLFDEQRNECQIAAMSGYDPEKLRGVTFTLEEAVERYCEGAELLDEGVYLIRNFDSRRGDERVPALEKPQSMLAMEIALGGNLEGLLIFDNFDDPNAFSRSDLQKLSRFREHAISAIMKGRTLRELETKNREAEQANEAKSAFLANMSHELRTPMNAIIGFSEILIERLETEMSPKYYGFLKSIHASGQHLLGIINDILDLSKIESGKMEIYPDRFSILPIVDGVCHLMKGMAQKQNVTFDIDVPADLPEVESDPGKLKQILYNLLSNAVKFSPAGADVRIAARMVPDGIGGEEAFEISVSDQGIGIAPENIPVVFEEFRQLDASTSRQFSGTGLGLSLVKRFVELQGGTVSVQSELGKGSTFTIRLPKQSRTAARQPDVPPARESRELVLVVEDDPMTFETIRAYLESESYEAVRATQQDEAVRLAKQLRPVAITLDLLLAEGDGWEVLKRIKSDEATRQIPVVIISMTENRELGLALGADDYLTKPVDRKLLLRRLRELTSGSSRPRPQLLLIDDDPLVHQALEEELHGRGYDLRTTLSGEDGLRLAAELKPDIVILDLMMPDLNGFEVAEQLKLRPGTEHIPIIVLTAKDLTSEDRARLHTKISGVVHKSASSRKNLVAIIHQLEHRQSAATRET